MQAKYRLVKQHDRVGRMADTMEYSMVALPMDRFSPELLQALQTQAAQHIDISDRDGDGQLEVIIDHLYIERRLLPLNMFLKECMDAGLDNPGPRAALERGDVFPETFASFLLAHPAVRDVFMRYHADLLTPEFWKAHQARIAQGHLHDVFPYDRSRRLLPDVVH